MESTVTQAAGWINELTLFIADNYKLGCIASHEGGLIAGTDPSPFISFSPLSLLLRSENLLLLLAHLGEWNKKHPTAQWIVRPEAAEDQIQFPVYYLLEPLTGNPNRSEAVLQQLQHQISALTAHLKRVNMSVAGIDPPGLDYYYPAPHRRLDARKEIPIIE